MEDFFLSLYSLWNAYPFEGEHIERANLTNQYCYFDDYKRAIKWADDFKFISSVFFKVENEARKIMDNSQLDEKWRKPSNEIWGDIYWQLKYIDSTISKIQPEILKIRGYETNSILPSNPFYMFLLIALTGGVFLCSVILPIFIQDINVILLKWVPSIFYMMVFCYLSYRLYKINY